MTRRGWFGVIAAAFFGRKAATGFAELVKAAPAANMANVTLRQLDLETLKAALLEYDALTRAPLIILESTPRGYDHWMEKNWRPGAVLPVDDPRDWITLRSPLDRPNAPKTARETLAALHEPLPDYLVDPTEWRLANKLEIGELDGALTPAGRRVLEEARS